MIESITVNDPFPGDDGDPRRAADRQRRSGDTTGTWALPVAHDGEEGQTSSGRRRWWLRALVLVAVLVGLGSVVTLLVEARLEARLSAALGAPVEIGDVELTWRHLAVSVEELRVDDPGHLALTIDRVDATLRWGDLLHAQVNPCITVQHPQLTLWVDRERLDRPGAGLRRIEGFESLEVVDGSLRLRIPAGPETAVLELTQIDGRLSFWAPPTSIAKRDLEVEVRAALGDSGGLEARGWLSSTTPMDDWTVSFAVRKLDLVPLNPLWRQVLHMDVGRGLFALEGELTRTRAMLRGRLRPHFDEMKMLAWGELSAHPMAEVLFGQMLEGAESDIVIRRPVGEGKSPSLGDLASGDWRSIVEGVIRRGYQRRLSEYEGFDATIEDVHADFQAGLLQIFDVQIRSRNPRIERPMIAVERIDVVFDRSVIDGSERAHKHVTLTAPVLNFVLGVEGQDNTMQFDSAWIDQLSAMPYQTQSLVIHDGRVDLWHYGEDEPVHAYVSDIELQGRHMAHDVTPVGTRGAELVATGRVFGTSAASLRMVFEPKSPVPNLDANLEVEPVPLETLAPILRAFAEVGAEGGSIGLFADISARSYRVDASVVPRIHDVELRAIDDKYLRKLVIGPAMRKLGRETLEMSYRLEPHQRVFDRFFPELRKAAFGAG